MEIAMKKLFATASLAALTACSTTSPDVVQRGEAQRLSTVQDATVLNVRPVKVEGSQSGVGAASGGVIGGLAGSSHSGGREAIALGVIGAVAGAVVGHTAERLATRESAVEILLQMKNGERRSIVQAAAAENFNPGDAVILVTTGGKTRVTRAPAGTPAPATAPAPTAPGEKPAPVYTPGGRS
jgi:outer membrane lipoprotein SlyB